MLFHALYETPMAPGRWGLIQSLISPDSYSHNGSLFNELQGIATNWMKQRKQIEIKLYVSKQTVIKWAGWTFIYISTGFEPSPFWEFKKVWLIFFFHLVCSAFPCCHCVQEEKSWKTVSNSDLLFLARSKVGQAVNVMQIPMFGRFPVQVCILRRSEQNGDKLKDLEVILQTKTN